MHEEYVPPFVERQEEPASKMDIDLDPRMPDTVIKAGPAGETVDVKISEKDAAKVLKIGAQLEPALKEYLISFLSQNLDVFAWFHADMEGIDPKLHS